MTYTPNRSSKEGREGIAVLRRAALDNVADVHLLPPHADGGEHPVQQLPGRADKRFATQILFAPRAFADKQPAGLAITAARYGLLTSLA